MRMPSKRSIALAAIVLSRFLVGIATADAGNSAMPADAAIRAAEAWAFSEPQSPDPSAPRAQQPDAQQVMRIADSPRSYTLGELSSNFLAPDWFPEDHPRAPHVVLYGRKPAWACGACHYPNGEGDTTSPTLAGLPKVYILEQIRAFRDGQRRPPDPSMAEEARNLDEADLQQDGRLLLQPETSSHQAGSGNRYRAEDALGGVRARSGQGRRARTHW